MNKLKFWAGLALPLAVYGQNLDSNQIRLSEISITETRIIQKKSPSSASAQLIGPKDLQMYSASNTADILTISGAAFMQKSQGGGGSPVLRGLEANKVLIVVDGVRMNNAIFRGGHLQNVLRIDANALHSVEVAYGPSSVMFGSDALGGTMYFTTKSPKIGTNEANLLLRAANATGDRVVHADAMYSGAKWAGFTSVSRTQFGNIVQGSRRIHGYSDFGLMPDYVVRGSTGDSVVTNSNPNRQVGTSYEQVDVLQKLLWEQKTLTHTVNFQHSQTGNVDRYDRLTERSGGLPKYAEWYYGPETRTLVSYRVENRKATKWYDRMVVTTAYQELRESRNSRKLNASSLKSQRERVAAESATLDFYRTRGAHHLQFGGESYWNQVQSVADNQPLSGGTPSPAATRYPDGGAQTVNSGMYFQNRVFSEGRVLAYHYGARLNYNLLQAQFTENAAFPLPVSQATQQYTSLSWNAGLSYDVNTANRFVLTLSNGFRAPNVDDLSKVFESANGQLILPNANLGPEKATQAELKWTHSGSVWRAQLGGYATLLNQVIGLQFTGDSLTFNDEHWGVYQSANLDQGLIRGIFANIEMKKGNWSGRSNLNVQRGTNYLVDGSKGPLDHIPPTFGMTSVKWKSSKWALEAWAQYAAAKRIEDYRLGAEDNEQYATPMGMPAWTTINLRADYILSAKWSVQLAVQNLADVNYRYFASGVSAPGRNVQLTLRATL